MADSIFTKIINREIPAELVYEDEHCVAFRDIQPQAPTHFLVVPRKPIVNLSEIGEQDSEILSALLLAINKIATKFDLHKNGFRVVQNNGEKAGQSVFHLHFHILAGRDFDWPPG